MISRFLCSVLMAHIGMSLLASNILIYLNSMLVSRE